MSTKFVSNKTRAKQRRTKEPAKMQVLEQGSGEPRVSRSALSEPKKDDERLGSSSSLETADEVPAPHGDAIRHDLADDAQTK